MIGHACLEVITNRNKLAPFEGLKFLLLIILALNLRTLMCKYFHPSAFQLIVVYLTSGCAHFKPSHCNEELYVKGKARERRRRNKGSKKSTKGP